MVKEHLSIGSIGDLMSDTMYKRFGSRNVLKVGAYSRFQVSVRGDTLPSAQCTHWLCAIAYSECSWQYRAVCYVVFSPFNSTLFRRWHLHTDKAHNLFTKNEPFTSTIPSLSAYLTATTLLRIVNRRDRSQPHDNTCHFDDCCNGKTPVLLRHRT